MALFGPGGARGAHHFELHPLVCIVCSGKVEASLALCAPPLSKLLQSLCIVINMLIISLLFHVFLNDSSLLLIIRPTQFK